MRVSPKSKEIKHLEEYVAFIRKFSMSKFGIDISDVDYLFVDGMKQAGLFLDFKGLPMKIFWMGQLRKVGIEHDCSKPVVAIDQNIHSGPENLLCGIIFHEFGHAILHKLGKNNAAKEPNACAIELMALVAYLEGKTDLTEAAKEFVLARKNLACYGAFDWSKEEASAAYLKITGDEL